MFMAITTPTTSRRRLLTGSAAGSLVAANAHLDRRCELTHRNATLAEALALGLHMPVAVLRQWIAVGRALVLGAMA